MSYSLLNLLLEELTDRTVPFHRVREKQRAENQDYTMGLVRPFTGQDHTFENFLKFNA